MTSPNYFLDWLSFFEIDHVLDLGRMRYLILKDESSINEYDTFLHEEINKDLTRLYPRGQLYFFQNKTYLSILHSILYIWCKQHASLSYRQGMVRKNKS